MIRFSACQGRCQVKKHNHQFRSMWQKCNSVRASDIHNEKYLARLGCHNDDLRAAQTCAYYQKHASTLAYVALTIQNLFPQNKDA